MKINCGVSMLSFLLVVVVAIGCCGFVSTETTRYEPNWKSLDSRPLPEWYDKAKIGIFLHWGVFSVPSYVDEWFWDWWLVAKNKNIVDYMARYYKPNFTYAEFGPQFTAEFFDAYQWAELFKKSGARYVVLTTKHHEGFTLWPSKFSFNWNAMDVGPNRDLVGELGKEVRAHGLHYGLYHSWFEWFNPMYLRDKNNSFKTDEFVRMKARPELEELINTYQPDVLWSDGDGEAFENYWNSKDFLAWLYNDSPVKDKVVVNDRWGIGTNCKHGGFLSCNDRYNPGVLNPRKWENAMTIDMHSWGYRREAALADYLSIEQLISNMVIAISCGGNVLINIGPTKEGTIAPIFQERLTQLGEWLEINGEAIYESTPWKHQNDTLTKGVWYTQKQVDSKDQSLSHVYASVLKYPESGTIEFGAIQYESIKSIRLLGSNQIIKFDTNSNTNGTMVVFPNISPNSPLRYAYVFAFQLIHNQSYINK